MNDTLHQSTPSGKDAVKRRDRCFVRAICYWVVIASFGAGCSQAVAEVFSIPNWLEVFIWITSGLGGHLISTDYHANKHKANP